MMMINDTERKALAEKIWSEHDKLGVLNPGSIGWAIAISALEAALSTEAQPEVKGAVAWRYRFHYAADSELDIDAETSRWHYTDKNSIPSNAEVEPLYPPSAIEAAVREKLEEAARIADHEYRAGIIEKDMSWAECSEYIRDAIRALMESPQPSVEEPAS